MEPPASLGAADLQSARERVIRSFRPLDPAEVVLGQFDGYRAVKGIDPKSKTDTFVAAKLWIDNARWKGVPFFLRTGKRLPHRTTEVAIVLREPERRLFEGAGIARLPAHHLRLRVQPDEGIALVFRAKEPGPGMALDAVPMDFSYGSSFKTRSAEAYERLLHDAMGGDQTLFLRQDAVERSWAIVAPVLDASGTVRPYAAGTWGPSAADELITPRAWRPG